jgi:hypothetical protein
VPTAAVGTGLSNYAITYVNGSLTVNPLPVTLTGNRIYDATTTVTAGILTVGNKVGADDVSAASGSGLVASANVGTQPITSVGTLALSGTAAGNYTLAGATGSLTITPATLTYTANSATRPYGSANPAFSGTVSGFIGTDSQSSATTGTVTFTSPATIASNPGSYSINGLGLVANSGNYIFVQAPGNATALTITQAVLMVKADDKSKSYGASNPALTASYVGFVNGDTAAVLSGAPDLTTIVTTNTAPGVYPITAARGSLTAANYTFAFQDGQFTVATMSVPAVMTGIQVGQNWTAMTFTGGTGVTYQIQRATALQSSGTAWTNIGSAMTDSAGKGKFTDTNPPQAKGYYRTMFQ